MLSPALDAAVEAVAVERRGADGAVVHQGVGAMLGAHFGFVRALRDAATAGRDAPAGARRGLCCTRDARS
jgi:hypothetical protein